VPSPDLQGNQGETPSEQPTRCRRYFRQGQTNRSTTRIGPRLKPQVVAAPEPSMPGCNTRRVRLLLCKETLYGSEGSTRQWRPLLDRVSKKRHLRLDKIGSCF